MILAKKKFLDSQKKDQNKGLKIAKFKEKLLSCPGTKFNEIFDSENF